MDSSILNCSSATDIKVCRIGQDGEPLIRADEFMLGANYLKEFAVKKNQFCPADNYYPGIRMPIPLIYTVALAGNLRDYISRYFGFDPRQVKKAVSSYSIVTTPPTNLHLLQKIPHFDAANKTSIAAVHYLFDEASSGTAMYRHRKTGFEFVDEERYSHYMATVKSQFPNSAEYPVGYINSDTSEYELVERFSAKFNRLILYRGRSLHSGCIGDDYLFDENPGSGRLTITTFLEFGD